MAYLPLRNYKYDSGVHRIQSGPAHEGFIVSSSGVMDTGADNGIVVAGTPNFFGAYDSSWRTLPYTASGTIFDVGSTAYQPSGALSSYTAYRTLTRTSVANSSVADSIGADYGLITNGIYTNLGGVSPSSQVYSPYNTPAANTAAEGYTGGGVTHRSYENGLLINTLGSQGTSDRSQWRYSQPVYCKTYTETVRPDSPGLMSTAVRYVYRGESTRYSLNTGAVMAYASPRAPEPDLSIQFTTVPGLIYTPWSAPSIDDAVGYTWLSNGSVIEGANSSVYEPSFDTIGTRVSVVITNSFGVSVQSKSYVPFAAYDYKLERAVTRGTYRVLRKISGEATSCAGGPTPDINANPVYTEITGTITSILLPSFPTFNRVTVIPSISTPVSSYTRDYSAACPLGAVDNFVVDVRGYSDTTNVFINQTSTQINALFQQAAYRFSCVLVELIDADTGERVYYDSVVAP